MYDFISQFYTFRIKADSMFRADSLIKTNSRVMRRTNSRRMDSVNQPKSSEFIKFQQREPPSPYSGKLITQRDSIRAETPKLGLKLQSNISNPWDYIADTPRRMTRQQSNAKNVKTELPKAELTMKPRMSKRISNMSKKSSVSMKKVATPKPKKEEVKSEKSSQNKEHRWSKENDRVLFLEFEKLIKAAGISEKDFLEKEKRMPKVKKDILKKLKDQFDWRGTIYSLRNRIQKRLKTPNFTAREQRVLKRKLREHAEGKCTIEQVAKHFAGKTMEQVEEFKKDYFAKVGLDVNV